MHWSPLVQAEQGPLHGEVARRMESRLQWMRQAPENWLDWSPTLGGFQRPDRFGELVIGGGSDPYELYSTRSTLERRSACLEKNRDSGAVCAISFASESTLAASSANGTTRSTRPMASAAWRS